METVLIVVHLMIVIALVAVVLLQRSEGGALSIGGGGGGNFMSARGKGNPLTRITTYLAFGFFATSIGLSVIASISDQPGSILDRVQPTQGENGEEAPGSILDQLGGQDVLTPEAEQPSSQAPIVPDEPAATPGGFQVPAIETPAAPAPDSSSQAPSVEEPSTLAPTVQDTLNNATESAQDAATSAAEAARDAVDATTQAVEGAVESATDAINSVVDEAAPRVSEPETPALTRETPGTAQ